MGHVDWRMQVGSTGLLPHSMTITSVSPQFLEANMLDVKRIYLGHFSHCHIDTNILMSGTITVSLNSAPGSILSPSL